MKHAPLISAAFLLAACGDGRPEETDPVSGTISATVFAGGSPVTGATCTLYHYDAETGVLGEAIDTSEATSANGLCHLETTGYDGRMVVVARGVGASFVESATGTEGAFTSTTELRSYVVDWETPGVTLDWTAGYDTDRTLVVSYLSDLAARYADARFSAGRDASFAASLEASARQFVAHAEYDFWDVAPSAMAEVSTFDEGAKGALIATSFSMLAKRIAVASGSAPGSVGSLTVYEALARDISDGLLDGTDKDTTLTLGACTGDDFCTLNAHSFRADLAESAAMFLASSQNASTLSYGVAKPFLDAFSFRTGDLWAGAGIAPDRAPPTVTLEGLTEGAEIKGEDVTFTLRITDAFELGTTDPIVIFRDTDAQWTEGLDASVLTVSRDETNQSEHVLSVTIDSGKIVPDGHVQVRVTARDKTGNENPAVFAFVADNVPGGSIQGEVFFGGRVHPLCVTAYDVTGGPGTADPVLATTKTGEGGLAEGRYALAIPDSPSTTEVLIVAENCADEDAATFTDALAGGTMTLSDSDVFEVLVDNYSEGTSPDANITPWTHIGAQFAKARWAYTYSSEPADFGQAIAEAYSFIGDHLRDPTLASFSLRALSPSDPADPSPKTLTAETEYGLSIAALSQLSSYHRLTDGQLPSINIMTLTRALADDLSDTTSQPYWDGTKDGVALTHGTYTLDSQTTRPRLAGAILIFDEDVAAFPLGTTQLSPFATQVSLDNQAELYADSGEPLDSSPPALSFTASSPAPGTVFGGTTVAFGVTATDFALDSLVWTSPYVEGAATDQQAGPTEWTLTGMLNLGNTTNFPNPDDTVVISAQATDKQGYSSTASLNLVLDRSPPTLTVSAVSGNSEPLGDSGWTGSAVAELSGTVADANGATVSYCVGAGCTNWTTVSTLSAGNWSQQTTLSGGANLVRVRAVDVVGNESIVERTYNRDTIGATISVHSSGSVHDESAVSILDVTSTGVSFINSPPVIPMVDGASFTLHADHYFDGPGLPTWVFLVTDNAPFPATSASYQISTGTGTLFTASPQSVPISADGTIKVVLDADAPGMEPLINYSTGVTLSITIFVEDYFGNTSNNTFHWEQTVVAPPLHAQAFSADNLENDAMTGAATCDPEALSAYRITKSVGGCGGQNLASLIRGLENPRVAGWTITNPHQNVSVQFRWRNGAAPTVYPKAAVGKTYDGKPTGDTPWGPPLACLTNLDMSSAYNACYTYPTVGSPVAYDLTAAIPATISTAAPQCSDSDCTNAYELAPGETAVIYLRASDFSFLDPTFASSYNVEVVAYTLFGIDAAPTTILKVWQGVLDTSSKYERCVRWQSSTIGEECAEWQVENPIRRINRARVEVPVVAMFDTRPVAVGAVDTESVYSEDTWSAVLSSFYTSSTEGPWDVNEDSIIAGSEQHGRLGTVTEPGGE